MKTVEVRAPAFLSHVTSCLWLLKALTMMLPRDPSFQNHPWGCFQLFPILASPTCPSIPSPVRRPTSVMTCSAKPVRQPRIHVPGGLRVLPRGCCDGAGLRTTLGPEGVTNGGVTNGGGCLGEEDIPGLPGGGGFAGLRRMPSRQLLQVQQWEVSPLPRHSLHLNISFYHLSHSLKS